MLNPDHPRDLLMIAAIFGVAALVWAGWAQDRPPSVAWRVYLAIASIAALALVAFAVPAVVGAWSEGTAITPGTPEFIAYLVWFWVEVVVAVGGAIMLTRRKRTHLIAPFVLLVVGLHFFPLAVVFAQPVLHGVAVLLAAIAVSGFVVRRRMAEPSFWCGALAAPVFLAVGVWTLTTGLAAA
ncbi:hypothetical protein ACTU3I_14145 [Microbacterium sp. RD1]|uniref:hypothetical protein n=1 Tax=Microbacterium sp. RD1 TaxID=3457313 RepID=UPI003FA5DCA5